VLEQSIEELSRLESLDYLVLVRKDGLEAIIDLVRPDSPDTGPKGAP